MKNMRILILTLISLSFYLSHQRPQPQHVTLVKSSSNLTLAPNVLTTTTTTTTEKPVFEDYGDFIMPESLLSLPESPLDEQRIETENGRSLNRRPLMAHDIRKLSKCQQNCTKGLEEALGLLMQSMNHVERYNLLCKNYNESYTCIAKEKSCGDEDYTTYETMTSGLQYMCVDQALAFNATIGCIDQQASFVQGECENECNTKNVFLNWLMRSSVARGIQNGISTGLQNGAFAGGESALQSVLAGPQPEDLDPKTFMENMQQMGSEMCTVGDCVLDCIRTKFDTRCEGSAGTLLSEVFVRPIAFTQEKMAIMSPIMGMFIPQQCNFLYNGHELAKHRIDPNLNEELRRMYAEKEAERLKALNESMANGTVPDFSLPKVESPFEAKTDLDSMISTLYPKEVIPHVNHHVAVKAPKSGKMPEKDHFHVPEVSIMEEPFTALVEQTGVAEVVPVVSDDQIHHHSNISNTPTVQDDQLLEPVTDTEELLEVSTTDSAHSNDNKKGDGVIATTTNDPIDEASGDGSGLELGEGSGASGEGSGLLEGSGEASGSGDGSGSGDEFTGSGEESGMNPSMDNLLTDGSGEGSGDFSGEEEGSGGFQIDREPLIENPRKVILKAKLSSRSKRSIGFIFNPKTKGKLTCRLVS